MDSIHIREVEIYHPETSIDNEHYLDHFSRIGQDVEKLLVDTLGRKERYVITDPSENSITMGIQAAKKALKKANLLGSDLDLIFFAIQTPEQLMPTNAMHVHRELNAGAHTLAYDINVNCTGMIAGIDQASRYMLTNPHVKRALLIGSDYLSILTDPEDAITHANFGDAACAIILEKSDENGGFIDASYHVNTSDLGNLTFPVEGFTALLHNPTSAKYIKELTPPEDTTQETVDLINKVLERNNMSLDDIDFICPSQFAISLIQKVSEKLAFDEERMLFVGDRYGYTASTSPFLAFYEGIQSGKIKRGDNVLFYTIGTGHLIATAIFKY